MSSFVVKVILVIVAITFLVLLVARFFRRVIPNQNQAPRYKPPMIIAAAGMLLAVGGCALALPVFTAAYAAELLPARIAAVVLALAGAVMLLGYRNWFVEPGPDAVRFRSYTGRERTIRYADIASFRTTSAAGRHRLTVVSNKGDTLTINPTKYDMSPLNAAADFQQRTGRWPASGELRPGTGR